MAETNGEQTLDQQRTSLQLSKRKPNVESCADAATQAVEAKKRRPDGSIDRLPHEQAGGEGARNHQKVKEEEMENEVEDNGVHSNGKAAVATLDKGKGVVAAVDKGKGKMVVEDESDVDDSDDGSVVVVAEEEYESDLLDDPLAEVDLPSILPCRTQRRDPSSPRAYLVNDLDGEDDDDDVSD